MPRLRVCVIGAGAAGLSAARHLTSELDTFDVQVFEQSSCVGGTWVFTEDTGVDERGIPVHSSVYRNLRYSRLFVLVDPEYCLKSFFRNPSFPTLLMN